ncbi:histidine kinase N-terminal 7TM domain-containing diguanylate cyclase [Paenibacillus wynnii]|uniref:histidine kinase N-terminal 7TM domain-containing diguanylate cyclase n=1 Tax=Paenibacillus wynnii TaxID=268407 RepID=UPI00278F242C|nr:diguanylate cyclase [Paenibacillus wynnii]MDQ0192405.1 diguanylate cyclase (GGDEF)-like protein/PAS domain S-box-containing protein [Paenibacillus wynnii]
MPLIQGYPYYLLMGSVLSLYMGISSHKYRKTPGRRYLWILMIIVSLIFAATAAEILSTTFLVKLWWKNVQQIPLFLSTLFVYAVVKDYVARPPGGLSKRLILFSIPVIFDVLFIFTDSYHHLMRNHVGMDTVAGISGISVEPTWLSMLFIAYDQIFSLYAALLLAVALIKSPRPYFRRNITMLAGLLIPVVSIFLLPLLKIKITGFTAMVMLPATLTAYFTIFRDPNTSIYPLAKHKIFENMKDGILLTDPNDQIIDINAAGEMYLSTITGLSPDTWLGKSIHTLLEKHWNIRIHYKQRQEGDFEIELPGQEGTCCYGATLVSTERGDSDTSGMLIIISDHSDKKRYERELVHQATVDDLTGLFNRRHFMRLVGNHTTHGGAGMALLLIDIDDFKLINDTYGHLAGDRALVAFSEKIQHTYRNKGIVGRVGGEEFAVCFFASDEWVALEEAEAFRATMGDHVVQLNECQTIQFTVSVGIAYTEQMGTTFEDLYREADEALYLSKATGKNKVTLGNQPIFKKA